MKKQKTTYIDKDSNAEWFQVDASDKILGRLSTKIANTLMGKHKSTYNPAFDSGDFVIVYNIENIKVTGKKADQKIYYSHSGYPGGLKETPYRRMLAKKPEEILLKAVKGMLPKNKLGSKMLTRLKVYRGSGHPHDAQQPVELLLKSEDK